MAFEKRHKRLLKEVLRGYQMTNLSTTANAPLVSLFEVELQYREGLAAITSPEGRIGQYLGSGDGTIKGSRLQGAVRWDLYEIVGELRCQTNFVGIIKTEDGAEIQFDATGFGIVTDRSKPNRWHMVNALQFATTDRRYEWLNTLLALWDGQFDMQTYRHYYQVYARDDEEAMGR
jgi:hypothetical protein